MVFSFLNKKITNLSRQSELSKPSDIKLTIVAFEDDCLDNSGKILAQILEKEPYFNVDYYDETFDKSFLDLQSRNFFDFIDTGKLILKKTKADVLIWGYREQNNLRLNFQTLNQYEDVKKPFFSLLNGLVLPLEYFQENKLPLAILNLIVATILIVSEKNEYKDILKEAVEKINNMAPPKDLDVKCMPCILNLLALAYLTSVKDNLKKSDIKIMSVIFKNALSILNKSPKSMLNGMVYANFGQLYQMAADLIVEDKYTNCKFATDFYNLAQKYFPRHTYPYDFGHNAYHLSKLYFEYWKYTSDIQFLRNAVFQLREAQKVFTQIAFPKFWAMIQKDLGLYLSMMAIFSRNKEIALMAVENYKNYQKEYSFDKFPLEWANAQENIGNIFFECGKIYNNEDDLDTATKYYIEALNVYEDHKLVKNQKQIEKCLIKVDEYILRISDFSLY